MFLCQLYEAYNAQRIAQSVGADKYAPDIMQEVQTDLQSAQAIQDGKHRDVKMEFTAAREAVERAEDARLTTLRKQDEQRQQQAQLAKQQAQMQAQQSQLAAQQAQADADRAAAQKAQADAARARAEADAANARAQAAQAQQQAQQSKESEEATREKLREQLNSVLQTTETARGLVMNLGDVLFDTNKYTLKPNAQVSLAKVSTILTLYPNLKVQVEGYTDSTGTPAYNQTLSENRADSVRNFLVQNGVPAERCNGTGLRRDEFRRGQRNGFRASTEPARESGGFGRVDRCADDGTWSAGSSRSGGTTGASAKSDGSLEPAVALTPTNVITRPR